MLGVVLSGPRHPAAHGAGADHPTCPGRTHEGAHVLVKRHWTKYAAVAGSIALVGACGCGPTEPEVRTIAGAWVAWTGSGTRGDSLYTDTYRLVLQDGDDGGQVSGTWEERRRWEPLYGTGDDRTELLWTSAVTGSYTHPQAEIVYGYRDDDSYPRETDVSCRYDGAVAEDGNSMDGTMTCTHSPLPWVGFPQPTTHELELTRSD